MSASNFSFMNREISRRKLFGGAAAVGATAFLASCSSAPGSGGGGTASTGGKLRVGYLGGSGADAIDPILTSGSPDIIRMRQMYNGLARMNEDGTVTPHLAEEITQEDPSTWVVRLREGVTFHNGKDLTADDVIFSIQRLLDPETSHNVATLGMIDPNGMEKLDELTVRLTLATPAYYLLDSFTQPAAAIVPTDFDPANPVGTGPFTLSSFTPGELLSLERYDDYWDGAAKVDALDIVTFSDESARINALQGGQIDHAPLIASSYTSVVEGAGNLKLHSYESGRFENFVLHTQSDEFKAPEVRRAMRMLLDRQQIVDQVYGGLARVGNDVPEPSSAYYNDSLPQWEHDPEEAMSMLRSAGAADMQLELITAPLTTTMVNLAEAYVQQLTEAGVDARVSQIDAGDFYGPDLGNRAFTQDIWGGWTFATFTNISQLPGSDFHETGWENEEFISAYQAASNTIDEDERRQHLWDAQEIMHDDSGTLIPAYIDVLDAYADNIEGYKTDVLGMGGGDFDYTEIHFTE